MPESQRTKNSNTDRKNPFECVDYLQSHFASIESDNNKLLRQRILYDHNFMDFMCQIGVMNVFDEANYEILERFVFNVVTMTCDMDEDIREWFKLLLIHFDVQSFVCNQKKLSLYLTNVFGKFSNYRNNEICRHNALNFFQQVINKCENQQNLIEHFLNALITATERWKPCKYASDMHEIVCLINNIRHVDSYSLRENKHILNRLVDALHSVIISDNKPIIGLPRDVQYPIPSRSDSHLCTPDICTLLLNLMLIDKSISAKLKNKTFCRAIISKNNDNAHAKLMQAIVASDSKLETFRMITRLINHRMVYVDFHDVYGALMILNELLNGTALITEKMDICLGPHLRTIIQNAKFFKSSKLSMKLLSDLCQNNPLVPPYLMNRYGDLMSQIRQCCKKLQNFIESKQKFIGEYTTKINLSEYSKSIYFLEIETEKGIINKKLILQ